MWRWQRTQGFAGFTHRSEILQLPTQPCSYSKKVPPEPAKQIVPPRLLSRPIANQLKFWGLWWFELPRFYIARNTRWPCDRGAFAASLISPHAKATACGPGQARN